MNTSFSKSKTAGDKSKKASVSVRWAQQRFLQAAGLVRTLAGSRAIFPLGGVSHPDVGNKYSDQNCLIWPALFHVVRKEMRPLGRPNPVCRS
jgi:hypothetical protein